MSLRSTIFIVVLALAFGLFLANLLRIIRYIRLGKPDNRYDQPFRRLLNVIVIAFGQKKLLREAFAGWMHFFIFWGFVVLLAAILETIGEGFSPQFTFSFLGVFYAPLIFLEELLGVLVTVSVIAALYRRYVMRPKRLQLDVHARIDATIILVLILLIMISMFGQNASRISLGYSMSARWVSTALSSIFGSSSESRQVQTWFEIFWWMHILLVLAFLNYLPYSKHFHVVSSIPNVYFSSLHPPGELKPLDLEVENVEKFGALDVEDLSWKNLLDGYTCTECGRCTEACPANYTGKPLSPRKIIMDIRDRMQEKGPLLLSMTRGGDDEVRKGILERTLVHHHIADEELWSCTTCMACVQECPVMIEHVPAIIEMRRGLVLTESNFPPELQPMYQNLERNFTPWAFSYTTRADWAEGLNIKTLAEDSNVEVLFWVGCAGSFDARYKKVAVAFAKLMQRAGVKFGILGTEEKCTGDPARRTGNEYLAQMLMKENIETLNRYHVAKIVTMCPHCFNTLKNEYRQFGGTFEVVHHTQFIYQLIEAGRLKVSKALSVPPSSAEGRVTYHDPCYLGRYNSEYDAPRAAIKSIPGLELVEMGRSRDRSFCCGAGGGRMWMEETIGKRINLERTEEALSLKPDVIATACPFCMTMLSDGVKMKEQEEEVKVRDVAELILEAIEKEETDVSNG